MKLNSKSIAINGLAIALVCISTMIIQIPIPLGYCHLGNCMILLISFLFPWKTGLLAGGIGSALADLLTGFPIWIVPTLIIKGLMGCVVSIIAKRNGGNAKMMSARTALASLVGIAIMVVGYTTAGIIVYSSVAVGITQIPGLAIEGIVGIILFYAFGFVVEKAGIQKYLTQKLFKGEV